MAFFGFMEILFVVVLSGNVPTDAVSFIPTAHYFKSRNVDVSIDKLVELACKEPGDPKTHVMQLVAMKALTEDTVNFKKSAKYDEQRKLLEEIAAGKKAQDSAGFAKEYAGKLLAKLDGKTLPPADQPKARAYEEALAWFPANASFVQVMDNRIGRNDAVVSRFLTSIQPLVPDREKGQIYEVIEKMGNIQLDRISMALVEEKEKVPPGKFKEGEPAKDKDIPAPEMRSVLEIYVRVTGRANRIWVAEMIAKEDRGIIEQAKGPNGEEITYVKKEGDRPPAVALIGSTEMLVCGFDRGENNGNFKILQRRLDLRAGKGESVLKGPLAGEIAKLPAKAHGLVLGKLPAEMGRGAPFAFPTFIVASAVRTPQGQDLSAELSMQDKERATNLVQLISQSRTSGLDMLKKLQDNVPPNVNLASIVNTLESLQVQAKENVVSLRVLLTDDAILSVPFLILGLQGLGGE